MATYQDGASVARVRGADDKTLFSGRRTWVVTVDLSTSCHPAISEDSTAPTSVGRSDSQAPVTASAGSVFTNIDRHVAGSEPSHMMRGRRAPSVPFSCQPVFTVVHRTARSPYPGPADDSRMGPPHTCPSRSSTAGRPDRHQRDKRCGEDSDRRNGLWRPHRYQGLRKAAQLDHTSTTQAVAMSHTTAKQALSEAAEEVSKPRTSRASPGASSTGPPSPPTVRISQ